MSQEDEIAALEAQLATSLGRIATRQTAMQSDWQAKAADKRLNEKIKRDEENAKKLYEETHSAYRIIDVRYQGQQTMQRKQVIGATFASALSEVGLVVPMDCISTVIEFAVPLPPREYRLRTNYQYETIQHEKAQESCPECEAGPECEELLGVENMGYGRNRYKRCKECGFRWVCRAWWR